nr:hypothetical protein [Escherichia coli]
MAGSLEKVSGVAEPC